MIRQNVGPVIRDDERYASLKQALNRANIGKIYYNKRLEDYGSRGVKLAGYVDTKIDANDTQADGMCWRIEGQNGNANDELAKVFGRAWLLLNNDVLAGDPIAMLHALSPYEDWVTKVENPRVLICHSWFRIGLEPPLPQPMMAKCEAYVRTAMERGTSVVFSGTGSLNACEWWSPEFRAFVLSMSEGVE